MLFTTRDLAQYSKYVFYNSGWTSVDDYQIFTFQANCCLKFHNIPLAWLLAMLIEKISKLNIEQLLGGRITYS